MPAVSVIVPVYNVEKYLKRCVDSILNQTFTDFELILVDDGSTDKSGLICDEYAECDGRVKVIHKENGGLSEARNFGIDIATGEYLSFIDSDDWVKKTYIGVLYSNIKSSNADISVVNLHKEYDDRFEPAADVFKGSVSGEKALEFLYKPNMSIYINVACAKLYKKDLFKDVRYPVGKCHEDGFTTYRLLYAASIVCFSDEDLYCYYQREGSIMNKFSENRLNEYEVYIEREKFFKDNNLKELEMQNKKTRCACIKSLTVKMFDYDMNKQTRKKWLAVFRQDLKSNITQASINSGKLYNYIYLCSPWWFHKLCILKRRLGKALRKKNEISSIVSLIFKTVYARMFFKNKFAFLMFAPIGGNLGDQALTSAEINLLKDLYLIEMPCPYMSRYFKYIKLLKKIIDDGVILCNAGGNLGTLWYDATELYLRKILVEFPNNTVIVLPNTCYYEDNDWGKSELEKSIKIYNSHKDLTIFARENISYFFMKNKYKNVLLAPDMVMSLKCDQVLEQRSGVLVCLREDCEKTLDEGILSQIIKKVEKRYNQIIFTDTVIPGRVTKRTRKERIKSKLAQFSKAEFVLTDRLHGMVFAAITATPCIVIKSKSHKLQGCYKWIEHLEYVKFINEIPDIDVFCDNVVGKSYQYDNKSLVPYYEEIKKIVYDAVRKK